MDPHRLGWLAGFFFLFRRRFPLTPFQLRIKMPFEIRSKWVRVRVCTTDVAAAATHNRPTPIARPPSTGFPLIKSYLYLLHHFHCIPNAIGDSHMRQALAPGGVCVNYTAGRISIGIKSTSRMPFLYCLTNNILAATIILCGCGDDVDSPFYPILFFVILLVFVCCRLLLLSL